MTGPRSATPLLELDGISLYFYGREKVPQKLEPGNVNYELSWGAAGIVDYLAELGGKVKPGGSERERIVAAYAEMGRMSAGSASSCCRICAGAMTAGSSASR